MFRKNVTARMFLTALAALLALALGTVNALAVDASGTWTATGKDTQYWSVSTNWQDDIIAEGAGQTGTFRPSPDRNQTIQLDASHTLGTMIVGSSNSRSQSFKANTDMTLTFDNSGSTAQLTYVLNSGNNTYFYCPILLNDSLNISNNDNTRPLYMLYGNSGYVAGNASKDVTITNNGSGTASVAFQGAISDGTNGKTISIVQSSATSGLSLEAANTFSGSTTNSSGIISLGNSLALQNSALDTTASIVGNNVATGNGLKTKVATLTLGGLTGNKDFASLFNTVVDGNNLGYGAVTALTLNPGTGKSYSYDGAIANGAANMTLTKTGDGTQILSNVNSFTGGTIVSGGTLLVENAGALPAGRDLTIGANGTVELASNMSASAANGAALSASAVPEPGTVALLAAGLAGLLAAAWRRRR